MTHIKRLLLLALLLAGTACEAPLERLDDLSRTTFQLIDQDSSARSFPTDFLGQPIVVGYIFTNCYDICPLTTNNMARIASRLDSLNIGGVQYVAISFDPLVDRPSVLRSYARLRGISDDRWSFLTGQTVTIDSLMRRVGMTVVPVDSTFYADGSKSYYYIHTDRIQLFDANGVLRRNYSGSKIRLDEITRDIVWLSQND
jgi:protein SCO1/2